MPWYVIFLAGVIVGGILFNAQMRRGFLNFLDSLTSKKGGENIVKRRRESKTVTINGKKYRMVE